MSGSYLYPTTLYLAGRICAPPLFICLQSIYFKIGAFFLRILRRKLQWNTLKSLFHSRDKPQSSLNGSRYNFFYGSTTAGNPVNEPHADDRRVLLREDTKGHSITFSTPTIEGTVIRRNKPDGQDKHPWKAEINEDDALVTVGVISVCYTSVYEPDFTEI